MPTASPTCSWALASCAGFPTSETAGPSLLPLITWGYLTSGIRLRETDRDRHLRSGLGLTVVGHDNVHPQGGDQGPSSPLHLHFMN